MADASLEAQLRAAETPGESSDSFEDAQEASAGEVNGSIKSQDKDTTAATEEPSAQFGDGPLLQVDGSADTERARQGSTDQSVRPTRPGLSERSVSPSKRLSRPISISHERSSSPTKGKRLSIGLPIRPSSALSDVSASLVERPADEQSEAPSSPPRQPDPPTRKASSGFAGLFGRMSSMGTMRRSARSPPGSQSEKTPTGRRSAAASITSIDTNGLASIADDETPKTAKRSLQDQFKSLRQQEENGPVEGLDEQKTPVARKWSDASGTSTSPSAASSETARSRASSALKSPTFNPGLPPGTAAGVSVGPAVDTQPVNWDLWQTLVYEGPEVVARTSGEDLNRAIASGIPSAIRGVVWQVLAESKNENLENIYRTLKGRGPDMDAAMHTPPLSRAESQISTTDDGSILGSTSPVDGSEGLATPPSRANDTPASDATTQAVPSEVRTKLLVEKQKREAAAIAKLEKVIKRDMGTRTSFSKYVQSAGLQSGLFGVCKAYALFDEGVGYAQGINFITMPLLFNMSEEEAFTLLVRLMSKYDVRSLFTAEMPGLHLRLYQFERLLEDLEPALYCHLKRRNVSPQLYATQWFLTLFAYRFPLQLVLRIYDLIFGSGLSAILQIGIVLMQKNRQALLDMKDMSQLTTFLKEKLFDVYIDKSPSASSILDSGFFGAVTGGIDKEVYRADELVRDACGIRISDATLTSYSAEWEESQRIERERTEELERLRVTNLSLTSRVKALEEQVQQQDTEHVTIAGDLVRVKVANDELHDENEGLKIKVTELQRMVDLQPGEVEGRLKEEMDRIMQRNIEVQNENRAMREEMDDVENELVKAKMSYAEIQADHDTLKQKWSSVQAMLNAE